MQIHVTITGDKKTIAHLNTVKEGLLDMSRPMQQIGEELKSFFSEDVFATQGSAIGASWPSLKPSTVKTKSVRYRAYSVVPLIRTGKMKDSFYSKSDKQSVEVGNTASYFIYHQSSAPRTKIPYRPMIAINDKVKTIAKKVIKAHVDELVRGA